MSSVAENTLLAGAESGKVALRRLLEIAATEPQQSTPLFLDFRDIEVATASYLRESVIAFRNAIRSRDSQYYPVVANPNGVVRDELLELTRAGAGPVMTCALAVDGTVSRPAVLGELEAKQHLTFRLVQEREETDAGELMRAYGTHEKIQTTAWNNRLASLAAQGLIIEIRQGRLKRYRPIFRGA